MFSNVNALFALNSLTSLYGNYRQSKLGRQQYGNLTEGMVEDVNAIAERSRQELYTAKQRVGIRARQAAADMGRLNAIAADTNLTGNTAQALQREILNVRDEDTFAIEKGAANRLRQSKRDIRATTIRYKNEMRGIKTPSVVGTGLQLFGDALDRRGPSMGELFSNVKTGPANMSWYPSGEGG